ncbi:hypothetical protein JW905_02710 [bacterium]|nr:hypothetical protein [candidate division CSSED10-310 bacterium]
MIRTVKAIVDAQGNVRVLEPIQLPAPRRALLTILDEDPQLILQETTLLSEAALAEDWSKPEEEEAWSYLQDDRNQG